jgi:hypothetical protein
MEERIVPAFNLAIDGDFSTSGVNSSFAAGTTTFTATASGATLDVADIANALSLGNVVITTGANGAEAGDVSWLNDSFLDELDYFGTSLRSMSIQTGGGAFTTDNTKLAFNSNVDFSITSSGGNIVLDDDTEISTANTIVLNAGAGNVTADSYGIEASGNLTVTAGTLSPGSTNAFSAYFYSDNGNLTVNAKIDPVGNFLYFQAGQDLDLNGTIDGAGDLELSSSGSTNINAAIGATSPLSNLSFSGGDVKFGNHPISADQINLNGGNFGEGTATVTGNVSVFGGSVTPGGVGAIGTLTIVGDVDFEGGSFSPDLGSPNGDLLQVTGDVTLNNGTLGSEGTGELANATPVTVLSYTGGLFGVFDNALDSTAKVFVGSDVVNVTYGPAAGGGDISVTQAAPLAAGTAFTGSDIDGTSFSLKLTGGGELVAGQDPGGLPFALVRNSTANSRLTVTTKKNASDNLIEFSSIVADGPLAGFTGPQVDITSQFRVTGFAKSITLHDLDGTMTLGGTSADKTSLTLHDSFSPVTTTSALTKLTAADGIQADVTAAAITALKAKFVTSGTITATGAIGSITTVGGFFSGVQAASVGTVKVGTQLDGSDWTVSGGVTSIAAQNIFLLDLTAKFLGSLSVSGSKDGTVPGSVDTSTFTLTGDDGSRQKYGLKSVTAKGSVEDTLFNVKAGNVDSVTVGRFIDSELLLNYTPASPFNTTGTFDSANVFKLNKFTTTATTIGDVNNPNNWAFAGSLIAADTVGTVKLSGVNTNNLGDAFGIKFRSAATSVKVTSADATIPFNTNLTASATALANDFFLLDV